MKNKYKLPQNREQKIKLLKDIAAGKITMDDLREKELKIFVWHEDENGDFVNDAGERYDQHKPGVDNEKHFMLQDEKPEHIDELNILVRYGMPPITSEKEAEAYINHPGNYKERDDSNDDTKDEKH